MYMNEILAGFVMCMVIVFMVMNLMSWSVFPILLGALLLSVMTDVWNFSK